MKITTKHAIIRWYDKTAAAQVPDYKMMYKRYNGDCNWYTFGQYEIPQICTTPFAIAPVTPLVYKLLEYTKHFRLISYEDRSIFYLHPDLLNLLDNHYQYDSFRDYMAMTFCHKEGVK